MDTFCHSAISQTTSVVKKGLNFKKRNLYLPSIHKFALYLKCNWYAAYHQKKPKMLHKSLFQEKYTLSHL